MLHEQGHCHPISSLGSATLNLAYRIIPFLPESWGKTLQERDIDDEFYSDMNFVENAQNLFPDISQNEVNNFTLYYRAAHSSYLLLDQSGYEHDIVLKLYAKNNDIAQPSVDEIFSSRAELSSLVRNEIQSRLGRSYRGNFEWQDLIPSYDVYEPQDDRFPRYYADVVEGILEENDLSFWAQKRAELYLEAVQYFVPSIEIDYTPDAESALTPNKLTP